MANLRIPFDSLALRCVSAELDPLLRGGHIQHITQPAPHDLLLTVRARGANYTLALSCDSLFARVHLTSVKRPNPPSPPAFCMLCRKYLEGGHILQVAQVGFDRILDITIEPVGGGAPCLLIAELMGKHSNLILIANSGAILDAAKRITLRTSRYREIMPGVPYVPPPAQESRRDPFAATALELDEIEGRLPADSEARAVSLMTTFAGLSPFLAQELTLRAGQASLARAWAEIFGAATAGEWLPVLARGANAEPVGAYPFPTVQLPADAQHGRDTFNTALDHYYSIAIPRAAADAAHSELLKSIDRTIKAHESKRVSLLRSLEESGRVDEYRHTGELLLANLHRIPPQAESISVTDYYAPDAPERAIPLDPARNPQENAEVYFRRYRKARDGAVAQQEQLQRTEEDLGALRSSRELAAQTTDLADIRRLRSGLLADGLIRAGAENQTAEREKRAKDFGGKRIRTVRTADGWEIYIGENSEANDYLTGRVAAPNDLWLHVRSGTSAHVVIRTRNNPGAVPRTVLERAAMLAAQHSPSKHARVVPVDYTLKRYVRRPRGAPSGTVTYVNEKTLHVSPAEEE